MPRPMEFKLCSLFLLPFHVFEQTTIFVLHVLYDMFLCKQSLQSLGVVPAAGAGLRPSGSSSGNTGGVRIYIRVREHHTPHIYICIYIVTQDTKMQTGWGVSEMWGGDRRDTVSDRDCHESISVHIQQHIQQQHQTCG